MYFRYLLIITTIAFSNIVYGQNTIPKESFPFIYATYSFIMPDGDMADKYGNSSDIGAGFGYKTKSNWLLGLEGTYLFGNDVKEDPLLSISNADEGITNIYGSPAEVFMRLSGFHFKASVGKIIPVIGSNANSGILIKAGAGMLQHRIFYSTTGNNVYSIQGKYEKGYDRLCNGLSLTEFIGWQHFSHKKFYHFFAGVEFTQGFTQNQRQWDFATNQKIDDPRLDLLYAFKVGLIIKFKSRQATEYYYF